MPHQIPIQAPLTNEPYALNVHQAKLHDHLKQQSFQKPRHPTSSHDPPDQAQLAQKKMYLAPEEIAGIVGRYITDNGGTLTISKLQNRIYIETEGLPKTELTPVQQNEFMTKYSDLKMKVLPNETGFTSNVVVLYTPSKN